ncbi:MAG: alpha/beta hydrolase [Pseudobdellovibrio sp.]
MKNIILAAFFTSLVACSSIPETAQINSSSKSKAIGKPPVVFIHGMYMTPACWKEWITYFKKENYQVTAPAWPQHEGSVEELRDLKHMNSLVKLTLEDVINYYRDYIKTLPQKPILIGHSMGGLVAQKLASEGLAAAAIAIHPAAPNGMLTFKWSFFKSNLDIVNPFHSTSTPLTMDLDQFSYRFANGENETDQKRAYSLFYVPESKLVGKGASEAAAEIDPLHLTAPLLLIAGGNDHIIPESLTYKNYNFYKASTAPVYFKVFNDRDHFTIGAPGWESVAKYSVDWLKNLE